MPRSLLDVWLLDDGARAPDAPPPLTDEQLEAFERQYGVVLPEPLVRLYRIQNGGFSLAFEFSFWPIEAGENGDMTALLNLARTFHQDEELENEWQASLGDLAKVYVFLGDGHFYLALNYNDLVGEEPVVWQISDSSCTSTKKTFGEWITTVGFA